MSTLAEREAVLANLSKHVEHGRITFRHRLLLDKLTAACYALSDSLEAEREVRRILALQQIQFPDGICRLCWRTEYDNETGDFVGHEDDCPLRPYALAPTGTSEANPDTSPGGQK